MNKHYRYEGFVFSLSFPHNRTPIILLLPTCPSPSLKHIRLFLEIREAFSDVTPQLELFILYIMFLEAILAQRWLLWSATKL